MPCPNKLIEAVNTVQEHPMKQVRFVSGSDTVPEVVSNSEPSDATIQLVSQENLGPQLKLLPLNDQIRELQTIIRDKTTSRGDFVFCADRLIRLVVEEGLNQLPYSECTVTTPTGYKYEGVRFERGNCGVSIMRSAMKLPRTAQIVGLKGVVLFFIYLKGLLETSTVQKNVTLINKSSIGLSDIMVKAGFLFKLQSSTHTGSSYVR
ncbi:uracil phosphoribosyltransferase homolog isoform X3 [Channa argus]|uniref:uracil phosphoribosyltransferase homolog isoform X3 n=1 Tax=Channa argus TaxID=215402 RepID=UPI0035222B31